MMIKKEQGIRNDMLFPVDLNGTLQVTKNRINEIRFSILKNLHPFVGWNLLIHFIVLLEGFSEKVLCTFSTL